jgi:glycosyltransferase involved in cell wall biosynthesis
MKICFDARVIINKNTGLGSYTYNIISNLLKVDDSNEYHVLVNKTLSSDHPVFSLNHKNLIKHIVNIPEVTPEQQFLVPIKLFAIKPDVYHYPGFDLPIFQPYRSVFTVHDLTYIRHRTLYLNNRWLKNQYTRHIMKWGVKKASKVIAVSKSTKQDLVNLLQAPESKIEVIYEAIDESLLDGSALNRNPQNRDYSPFLTNEDKYFLFLGERRPHKNIVRIIEAFAIFKQKIGSGYKLIIGGKAYASYSEPEKKVKELRLAESVIFLGYIEESELPPLYRNAICFLFPSIYEGFGIPILEAMACEVPVITSNLSSMPEIAGNAALTVDPYNVNEITDAMIKITSDSILRQQLIQNGLKRVRDFSWKRAAEETLKVYEEIFQSF